MIALLIIRNVMLYYITITIYYTTVIVMRNVMLISVIDNFIPYYCNVIDNTPVGGAVGFQLLHVDESRHEVQGGRQGQGLRARVRQEPEGFPSAPTVSFYIEGCRRICCLFRRTSFSFEGFNQRGRNVRGGKKRNRRNRWIPAQIDWKHKRNRWKPLHGFTGTKHAGIC